MPTTRNKLTVRTLLSVATAATMAACSRQNAEAQPDPSLARTKTEPSAKVSEVASSRPADSVGAATALPSQSATAIAAAVSVVPRVLPSGAPAPGNVPSKGDPAPRPDAAAIETGIK